MLISLSSSDYYWFNPAIFSPNPVTADFFESTIFAGKLTNIMVNEIAADKLNSLIQINGKRIDSYETVVKNTDDGDLKEMFNNFIQVSKTCLGELVSEINILGAEIKEGSAKTAGAADVSTAKESTAILDACADAEDHVLKAYDKVLEDTEGLTSAQQSLIEAQYHKIKNCRDQMKDFAN